MSKDKRHPYVRGYDQGERDARTLLDPEIVSFRPPVLPDPFRDRCEWLDGYTTGMRRVVLDAKLGRPWREPAT